MGADAATPPGLLERIRSIAAEEVAKFMRSGFLRNASISEGGLTIRGGFLRLFQNASTAQASVFIGGVLPALPDGSAQPGLIIRRNDGTLALAMYDPTPGTGGGDYAQFLATYDRGGAIIVADDTASGQGLSRPYVPIPLTRARFSDLPAVTDAAFVDVFDSGFFHKVNARARADVRCTTDAADTTGEVRVLVDGVQVGATEAVGFELGMKRIGPFVVPGAAYSQHVIKVQARRTAGAGAVRLDASVWGVQS